MIRRQVVVPVSPERLWEALTDPDQVAGWFGGRVEWDLQEGGTASFRGDDGNERLGRIESIRPGRHLRFVWWPAAGGAGGRRGAPGAAREAEDDGMSEVSYLLEPLDDGTRLTIQERQIAAPVGAGPQASAARAMAAAETASAWTAWDGRLVGAWAGLAGTPVAAARS
jgi:uncharacterized protein YndB with AHSA1/START domain